MGHKKKSIIKSESWNSNFEHAILPSCTLQEVYVAVCSNVLHGTVMGVYCLSSLCGLGVFFLLSLQRWLYGQYNPGGIKLCKQEVSAHVIFTLC